MTTAGESVELEQLAERVATAEARAFALTKANGWLYRKWHVAADRAARLAAGESAVIDELTDLADEADRRVGSDRHDSVSGRVTTGELRRVIASRRGHVGRQAYP